MARTGHNAEQGGGSDDEEDLRQDQPNKRRRIDADQTRTEPAQPPSPSQNASLLTSPSTRPPADQDATAEAISNSTVANANGGQPSQQSMYMTFSIPPPVEWKHLNSRSVPAPVWAPQMATYPISEQRSQHRLQAPQIAPVPWPTRSDRQPERPESVRILVGHNSKNGKVVRDEDCSQKKTKDGRNRYSFAQRVQALTLMTHRYDPAYIEFVTGMHPKSQYRLEQVARSRGYNFYKNPQIMDAHVVDGLRTGRPKGSKDSKKRAGRPKKTSTESQSQALSDEEIEVEAEGDLQASTSEPFQPQGTPSGSTFEDITAQLAGIQDYLSRTDHNEYT